MARLLTRAARVGDVGRREVLAEYGDIGSKTGKIVCRFPVTFWRTMARGGGRIVIAHDMRDHLNKSAHGERRGIMEINGIGIQKDMGINGENKSWNRIVGNDDVV